MMKLNPQFLTHETLGEHYIIGIGETGFKGIIKSNETAAFIVERLKTYTSEDEIIDSLLAEYEGADRETVAHDVEDIIGKLRSVGALEE